MGRSVNVVVCGAWWECVKCGCVSVKLTNEIWELCSVALINPYII